jgi:homoserine dehydrogenase
MSFQSLRVLMVGFGHVGRTVARILIERDRYPALADLNARVIGIATASRGVLANADGVRLDAALSEVESAGKFAGHNPDRVELDTTEAVKTLDYDVLVELSPLSIKERGEPAATFIGLALGRGRHAISCNKGPIAWHWRELADIARERDVRLLHEGTVMDGVPVFNLARWGLRGNVITGFEGVLNSTTNVVLCALEQGASLEEAVWQAQAAGIAEADPSTDLEGWDAAVKVSVLANVLMSAELAPESVTREAVTEETAVRARAARVNNERLKVICEAVREGASVRGSVGLRELPLEHPFARLEGPGSALRISTDLLGTFVIAEEAPDLYTTAYAVINDLYALERPAHAAPQPIQPHRSWWQRRS